MKTRKNYRRLISSVCIAGIFLCAQAVAGAGRIYTLSADEWARPRSGEVIAGFSALQAAVHYWDRTENAILVVHYPGEDSGELWAAELRDWLISLGVPSDYIRLVSGAQADDEIRLVVGHRDQLEQ